MRGPPAAAAEHASLVAHGEVAQRGNRSSTGRLLSAAVAALGLCSLLLVQTQTKRPGVSFFEHAGVSFELNGVCKKLAPTHASASGGDKLDVEVGDCGEIVDEIHVGGRPCHIIQRTGTRTGASCTVPPGIPSLRVPVAIKAKGRSCGVCEYSTGLTVEGVCRDLVVAGAGGTERVTLSPNDMVAFEGTVTGAADGGDTLRASISDCGDDVDEILIDGHDCPLSGPATKMEASCTTPKGTAGTKDVELRSKGKTCARCTQAFHYNGICTNINPPNGPVTGNYAVTFTITDCGSKIDSVKVGGNVCADLRDASSTQVTCTMPKGVVGQQAITIMSQLKVCALCGDGVAPASIAQGATAVVSGINSAAQPAKDAVRLPTTAKRAALPRGWWEVKA